MDKTQILQSFLHNSPLTIVQRRQAICDTISDKMCEVARLPKDWLQSSTPMNLYHIGGVLAHAHTLLSELAANGVDCSINDLDRSLPLCVRDGAVRRMRRKTYAVRLPKRSYGDCVRLYLSGNNDILSYCVPYVIHRIRNVDKYLEISEEQESALDKAWFSEILLRTPGTFENEMLSSGHVNILRRYIIDNPRLIEQCLSIKEDTKLIIHKYGESWCETHGNIQYVPMHVAAVGGCTVANIVESQIAGVPVDNIWCIPAFSSSAYHPIHGVHNNAIIIDDFLPAIHLSSKAIPYDFPAIDNILHTTEPSDIFALMCSEVRCNSIPLWALAYGDGLIGGLDHDMSLMGALKCTLGRVPCQGTSDQYDSYYSLSCAKSRQRLSETFSCNQLVQSGIVDLLDIAVQLMGFEIDNSTWEQYHTGTIGYFERWLISAYPKPIRDDWAVLMFQCLLREPGNVAPIAQDWLKRVDVPTEIQSQLTQLMHTAPRDMGGFADKWQE
jgi:hypothetical protein